MPRRSTTPMPSALLERDAQAAGVHPARAVGCARWPARCPAHRRRRAAVAARGRTIWILRPSGLWSGSCGGTLLALEPACGAVPPGTVPDALSCRIRTSAVLATTESARHHQEPSLAVARLDQIHGPVGGGDKPRIAAVLGYSAMPMDAPICTRSRSSVPSGLGCVVGQALGQRHGLVVGGRCRAAARQTHRPQPRHERSDSRDDRRESGPPQTSTWSPAAWPWVSLMGGTHPGPGTAPPELPCWPCADHLGHQAFHELGAVASPVRLSWLARCSMFCWCWWRSVTSVKVRSRPPPATGMLRTSDHAARWTLAHGVAAGFG